MKPKPKFGKSLRDLLDPASTKRPVDLSPAVNQLDASDVNRCLYFSKETLETDNGDGTTTTHGILNIRFCTWKEYKALVQEKGPSLFPRRAIRNAEAEHPQGSDVPDP